MRYKSLSDLPAGWSIVHRFHLSIVKMPGDKDDFRILIENPTAVPDDVILYMLQEAIKNLTLDLVANGELSITVKVVQVPPVSPSQEN